MSPLGLTEKDRHDSQDIPPYKNWTLLGLDPTTVLGTVDSVAFAMEGGTQWARFYGDDHVELINM
jgi:hypothetical protein